MGLVATLLFLSCPWECYESFSKMFCSEWATLHNLFGNTIKKQMRVWWDLFWMIPCWHLALQTCLQSYTTCLKQLAFVVSRSSYSEHKTKIFVVFRLFASLSLFLHWSFGAFCSIFCAHLCKIWVSWTAKLLVSMSYFWHGYAHMHSRLDDLWLY